MGRQNQGHETQGPVEIGVGLVPGRQDPLGKPGHAGRRGERIERPVEGSQHRHHKVHQFDRGHVKAQRGGADQVNQDRLVHAHVKLVSHGHQGERQAFAPQAQRLPQGHRLQPQARCPGAHPPNQEAQDGGTQRSLQGQEGLGFAQEIAPSAKAVALSMEATVARPPCRAKTLQALQHGCHRRTQAVNGDNGKGQQNQARDVNRMAAPLRVTNKKSQGQSRRPGLQDLGQQAAAQPATGLPPVRALTSRVRQAPSPRSAKLEKRGGKAQGSSVNARAFLRMQSPQQQDACKELPPLACQKGGQVDTDIPQQARHAPT